MQQWTGQFSTVGRRVALDEIDDIMISTVFLGLDHNYLPDGPPILFETMVFVGGDGEQCQRYATWDEAAVGHGLIVDAIRHHDEGAVDHATALFAHLRALRTS